jgi:hypothetical protein
MLDLKGNRITYIGHSTFSFTTPSGQVGIIGLRQETKDISGLQIHALKPGDSL